MDLWDAVGLKKPAAFACTGAGGKTSALSTLAVCARRRTLPLLLTTTTKMYWNQVMDWHPVLCDDFAKGSAEAGLMLRREKIAAWFLGRQQDKVTGLPPQWIDSLMQSSGFLSAYIAVEADGARGLLIKASDVHEPVVPASASCTIGVLSLDAIGLPLSPAIAHRLEIVMAILGKQSGELICEHDLAKLALHEQGVFQYSRGERILLLTGGSGERLETVAKIAFYLRCHQSVIVKCIVTEGYGEKMTPLQVIDL